jgi:hypothetical protein
VNYFQKHHKSVLGKLTPAEEKEEEEEDGVPKISLTSGRCLFWDMLCEVVAWHKNALESFVGFVH